MAFSLSIQGQIKDQNNDPVEGMTVRMRELDGDIALGAGATDLTDASGNFLLEVSSTNYPTGGIFYADPASLAPHYSDPGEGPEHEWLGTSDEPIAGENFVASFANNAPTRSAIGNKTYERDTGSHTADGTMGDADAGDDLTPVKEVGPAWGTLTKVNGTTYRWTFDTAGVAAGPYTFQYRIDDDWGGSSSSESFTVTITQNNPPVLTNPGTKTYPKATGIQIFDLSATDPDGDPITYEKVSAPAFVGLGGGSNPANRVTVDTGDASATVGAHPCTWRVTDGRGGQDEETHDVVISEGSLPAFFQVIG